MSSVEWALIRYDWCPYKKRLGNTHTEGRPCEEDGHLQAKERGLRKKTTNPADTLVLDFYSPEL